MKYILLFPARIVIAIIITIITIFSIIWSLVWDFSFKKATDSFDDLFNNWDHEYMNQCGNISIKCYRNVWTWAFRYNGK